MKSEQQIQVIATDIISFVNLYALINENKQNKQSESESVHLLSLLASNLNQVWDLIQNNSICKQVTNTPKILHSLSILSCYKLHMHKNQEYDHQSFAIRQSSRLCLGQILYNGDAQEHYDLVNIRYAGLLAIALSAAGGCGEEQDQEIYWGLNNLSTFLNQFHLGRYYNTPFPPQPKLAKTSVEQIEEEGGSEEFDAQLINKGRLWVSIINYANKSKAAMLNYFINS